MNICATRTRRRKFMVQIAMAFFALFLGNLTVPAFAASNGNTLSLASGGNLNIISEQNTSSYHYNSDSGSTSVSVGAAGGSGSGSFANTSIKDNAASVGAGQQSGLTASRTLNAIIAGNTNLDGGIATVIRSTLPDKF